MTLKKKKKGKIVNKVGGGGEGEFRVGTPIFFGRCHPINNRSEIAPALN